MVEVRLAGATVVLQVLLNQEVLSFAEQKWLDLKGEWHGRAGSPGCPRSLSLPPGLPHLSQALAGGRDGVQSTDAEAKASRSLPQGDSQPLAPAARCRGTWQNGHVPPAHSSLCTDMVPGPR